MPAGEFVEWMHFGQLAPFDSTRRLEVMLARLMTLTANVHRGKDTSAYDVEDFLPEYGEPEPMTDDQLIWAQKQWYKAIGGMVDENIKH